MIKKNYIIGISISLLSLLIPSATYGQKGIDDGSKYGHGQDSIDCRINYSLYREYVKQNAYSDAIKFWRKSFNSCPYSSNNLYIDGVKIYKYMADKEIDISKKDAYLDTVDYIYDKRVEYGMGKEPYIRQYQGLDLFTLKTSDTEALLKAHKCLKTAIEGMKDKCIDPAFISLIKTGILLYNNSEMEAEDVLADYLLVSDILASNPKKESVKTDIDKDMVDSKILDCNVIITNYTPKFEANPNDPALLTTITNFLDKLSCTDADLYYKALTNRHKIEPTPQSAKMLAVLSIKNKNYADAVKYAEEAIKGESDNMVLADLYLVLADATGKNGNLSLARTHAYKSAELNPKSGQPYLFIGNLYAKSNSECSDLALKNSIYWVAVDKFIKAKQIDPSVTGEANKYIDTYSQYYPNKEEAFFNGVKDGDTFKVGCWINETTTARF